ncbi:50S ribosomal protein L11 methyltransferase [Lentibacillus amyloliquefaciens]|uniref:Ribosomal protein L11 methyltransferase n=1 Tax=Lentibacillus amyloliquefaciens TaxID=1472767 RepID=A0A0U3WEB5_9BACI|nr:50S ribosomal protein L11 methyltransferase [Lentibacillus amyloliquefaciens]ALX48127.1 ribosomal protein L11 methyltransferase [Lentibacillus amyloliquefaciens]
MNWTEIRIHTTNEAVEPISNVLHEKGASGVVIEDPVDLKKERRPQFGEIYDLDPNEYPDEGVFIKTYLPSNKMLDEKINEMKNAIDYLRNFGIDVGKNEIELNKLKEEDWATAWKKYYKPVKISEKIIILPTWEKYKPKADEVIIELDPGMAFGTGTHPTTVLSIQAIEQYIKKDDKVIDVGCGSGVLSIAAGLLDAKEVHAFDLDDVAVKSTKTNCELNRLEDKVKVKQNDLLTDIDMQADLIVSNILAEIIVTFVSDAWKSLKPNGYFITSGIIKKKEQMVKEELQQTGFHIIEVNEKEDWVAIVAKKIEKESGA